jgi:predicted exporter
MVAARTPARWAIATWLLLAVLAGVIAARARYSADFSAFLPRAPSAAQALLVEQLSHGLAARLLLIGIEGADAGTRAAASRALAGELAADPQFTDVRNGSGLQSEREQQWVFAHRYVLSDSVDAQRFSADGLRAAVTDTLDLIASPAGLAAKSLLTHDPTAESLQAADRLTPTATPRNADGVWVARDGARALLLATTAAAGSDTDAQQQALAALRRDFDRVRTRLPPPTALQLVVSGPGAFAVAARATIKHEAVRLSLLSSAMIVLLLLAVYRSLPPLLLGLMPVASGALAGVAAVALGFDTVHGITLGFGITLIGEAVDYSIYLFIQSRAGTAVLWPTIGLGVATSICGFAALLLSDFPGLAQLGLYSVIGLLAAAAVTRYVLPALLPQRLTLPDLVPFGRNAGRLLAPARPQIRWGLLLLFAGAAAVLMLDRGRLWNHDLAALSPVPPAAEVLDAALRSDLGAPDVSTVVVASGADADSALQAAEAAGARLDALGDQGVIGGFDSPARYLPSASVQAARRGALPEQAVLRRRLDIALAGLPLRAGALEPFVSDVLAARAAPALTHADLPPTLATAFDALMLHGPSGYRALLPLRAPASGDIDLSRVRAALAGTAAIAFNLKQESDALYASYLRQALQFSALGLGAIVVLLSIALRSVRRMTRVLIPLLLAVTLVMATLALTHQPLSLLHLVGLLLIVAVGSNYALFFERGVPPAHSAQAQAPSGDTVAALMLASLCVANTATVIGFGALALSSVPVLHDLGMTVAPGALLALLLSAWLRAPS